MNHTDTWERCYESSYQGIITPESFCHPAKMSRSLLERIYDHAFAEGWLKEGSVVCDPFGGICTTGILGSYRKVRVVAIELEKRFCDLAEANFKLHDNAWRTLGCPRPVMIQGDSRALSTLIGQVDFILSSPPFQEQTQQPKGSLLTKWCEQHGRNPDAPSRQQIYEAYDSSPGQLGAMKPGSIDAILSSPPYADQSLPIDTPEKAARHTAIQKSKGSKRTWGKAINPDGFVYSNSPANLGNLKPGDVSCVISSPPYANLGEGAKSGEVDVTKWTSGAPDRKMGKSHQSDGYGNNPGNIANLPPGEIEAIISSPPFQSSIATKEKDGTLTAQGLKADGTRRGGSLITGDYGNSDGQLGNSQGDTFWHAAKLIVEQCYQILKDEGYAIWVVKDFVRKGQRVDFCGDWRRLCESAGLETLHEHKAMLVKEDRKPSLFGHEIVKTKSRKSFFRRLCESKGSPCIDWETVFCMQKKS